MTKPELKTAPLSIRIRPSLKAAIEEVASRERRSVAEFVEIVLEDYVNEYMNSEKHNPVGRNAKRPRK